jgi:signal peptidase I
MRRRHARDQPPKGGSSASLRWFRELAIIIVSALVLSALVRAFLVQAFFVPSASMENTLQIGDRILASKITTTMSGVSRGEIVVFKDPGGWLDEPAAPSEGVVGAVRNALTFIGLMPSDTGQDLVKRVIGVAGDRVACCDATGHIMLNGVPLVEDYIIAPTDQVSFDIVVPAGSVFVMGDNRGNSRDSRFHLDENNGGVPVDNVVGRVFLVVWPFSQMSTETIPSIFGDPAIADGPQGVGPSAAAPSDTDSATPVPTTGGG